MSELKPCPFCGSDVRYDVMMDGAYSFACPDCGLNARFPECFTNREGSTRIWNTRAERTCRPLRKSGKEFDSEERLSSLVALCSECLGYLGEAQDVFLGSVAFCSSCGAKVVVE